jgi:hypothetical protein
MNETKSAMQAEAGGTEITRFNALRHGVLSRYTVLPWEDAHEYRTLVDALVSEHAPRGPTEEHLVEELAGILWRKRRLRLAEAAAHRRGLEHALSPYQETVKAAQCISMMPTSPTTSPGPSAQRLRTRKKTSARWRKTRP